MNIWDIGMRECLKRKGSWIRNGARLQEPHGLTEGQCAIFPCEERLPKNDTNSKESSGMDKMREIMNLNSNFPTKPYISDGCKPIDSFFC